MTVWTLATSAAHQHHTLIGVGNTLEQAREQLIAATLVTIHRGDAGRPRYTLHLGGQLAAIIQTGEDEFGGPDHAGAAELVTHLRDTRDPYSTSQFD